VDMWEMLADSHKTAAVCGGCSMTVRWVCDGRQPRETGGGNCCHQSPSTGDSSTVRTRKLSELYSVYRHLEPSVPKTPFRHLGVVFATDPGNQPAVQVETAKTVWFGSQPVRKPDHLHHGGPNSDPYLSTHGSNRLWLDQSATISGARLWVVGFMVAFRYPIAIGKISTLVYRGPYLMYWPPLRSKTSEKSSMLQPANGSQRRVNDYWSCIFGNLSGNWMQMFKNEV
jgi:hypothetical protein